MSDDDLRFGDISGSGTNAQQSQIVTLTKLAIRLFVMLVVVYTVGKYALMIFL